MSPVLQHPVETIQSHISLLGRQCRASHEEVQPLPASVCHSEDCADLPLWLELCICVMRNLHCTGQQAKALQQHLLSENLKLAEPHLGNFFEGDNHPPLTPQRVAALAASAWRVELPKGQSYAEPEDACEVLLVQALQGQLPKTTVALDLTQLLLGAVLHEEGRGVLARLRLWTCAPPATAPDNGPRLVRAPAAVLLRLDQHFTRGLDRVQVLMDQVLLPSAAHVAWDLGLMEDTGSVVHSLPAVKGSSASAALAYATLWLLRDHLRPEFAAVRDLLHNSEPDAISITAELGEVAQPAPGQPFEWPQLAQIGGFDDKFGALNFLPTGRRVQSLFVAAGQTCNAAALPAHEAHTLLELVQHVARYANGGLSHEAAQLHALLMAADPAAAAPSLPARLLRTVAKQQPIGVKGYLLQRYAVRAGGDHSPFGAPAQLHRHFVDLELEPERERDYAPETAAADQLPQLEDPADRDQGPELADLLENEPYATVDAWLLSADPLAGKTTLLAAWEMRTARAALYRRHQNRRAPWGEVCVFLPMRGFADWVKQHADRPVGAVFEAFVAAHAPGLPPVPSLLSAQTPEPGLEIRLLLDALNEISTETHAERARLVSAVCDWLARPKAVGAQLAPVFSVRERENGLTVAATRDSLNPHWRARTARLKAWRRPEMRRYLNDRGMAIDARRALDAALGLNEADSAPLNTLAAFCTTPGILAAQCTLLQTWPKLAPPKGKGPLFLALLWHQLIAHRTELDDRLLPAAMRLEFSTLGSGTRWPLPPEPGMLVQQLAAQASAMHDGAGGSADEVPLSTVPPGLQGTANAVLRGQWLRAVNRLGLAWTDSRRFAFTHQQWREFFGALHLDVAGELPPNIEAPKLVPADEAALLRKFEQDKKAGLELPTVTPHTERIRFAASLSESPVNWILRLLPHNLPLAARVAVDYRSALERIDACGYPLQPFNGVLEHLRRELLLCSVDAGETVKARLRIGGVLHALEEPISNLPAQLEARWAKVYGREGERTFQGSGVDLRERLEAGFLLGELGDTLRYERVLLAGAGGEARAGLRLKARHWQRVGEPGRETMHRIGDAEGHEDERHEWDVELEAFEFAHCAVTVGAYRYFVDGSGYEPTQAWWGDPSGRARQWLEKTERKHPQRWDDKRFNNPLQPVVGISFWEAAAYAKWAQALYAPRSGQVSLPTEVQWEAAARSSKTVGGGRSRWPHGAASAAHDALVFNHDPTRFVTTSPVGVFSLGLNDHGAADLAGNSWDWCGNAMTERTYKTSTGRNEARTPDLDSESSRAVRGGSYGLTADDARAGYRFHVHPGYGDDYIGLRLVRVTLPHSVP